MAAVFAAIWVRLRSIRAAKQVTTMSGRICGPRKDKPVKDDGHKPAPPPTPDDDEDDGDIATPKRDRDDEAEAFDRR
jgi:hypothetical protein